MRPEVGIETADANLNEFLNADRIACNAVIWIYGVAPTDVMALTESIDIFPVEKMPESGDKEDILRNRLKNRTSIMLAPSAAIVTRVLTSKIYPEEPSFSSDLS